MATQQTTPNDFASELSHEFFGRAYATKRDVVISKLPSLALWKSQPHTHATGVVGLVVIRWWRDTEKARTPLKAAPGSSECWPDVREQTSQLAHAGIIPDGEFSPWGPL